MNSFGTTIMAAFAAAVKIDFFAYMPHRNTATHFRLSLPRIQGRKKERIASGIKYAAATSLTYCASASLILWFQAENLMWVFVSPSETSIIEEGVRYLHIDYHYFPWNPCCPCVSVVAHSLSRCVGDLVDNPNWMASGGYGW